MQNGSTLIIAILLTLFAGMSTMLGSIFAFSSCRKSARSFAVALGFSAGFMVYISFVDLLPEGMDRLIEIYGENGGHWRAIFSFFIGISIVALLDGIIPHCTGGRCRRDPEEHECKHAPLYHTGILAAIALAIHNLPEGFVTLIGVVDDIHIGVALAVAIAIHNIPEGISICVPVYAATGKKSTALWYTFIAGISEPIGAIIGYLLLKSCITGVLCGISFCGVAGMMTYLALDQLLPAARAHTNPHWAMLGFVAGMFCMAVSLFLLGMA
ncbi:zinc transporter ZupT [Patescibacteria group bacterium]|nr:zinc transporter ZupT [Patescibacteria group bacterium]